MSNGDIPEQQAEGSGTTEAQAKKAISDDLKKTNVIYALLALIIVYAIVMVGFFQNPADGNRILMNAAFFTAIGAIIYMAFYLVFVSFRPMPDTEAIVNIFRVTYKVARIFSISTFALVNAWILFVSPFSFFGGSVYGGIMQGILILPLLFLLINFWVSGSIPGLVLIGVACCVLFPLSFMFPTMFTNFYAISTGSSAAAGGTLMSNFAVVDPMSYYRSSILKQGITEQVTGPTFEEITDDVVGVEVEVEGRMCDDSDIVATVRLDNEAKYKISNVYVQLSSIKDIYASFFTGGAVHFDICGIDFEPLIPGPNIYAEQWVSDLPKGAPATVIKTFQASLPPDVLQQYCGIRTDVVLSYHTTSVFPLTFIDSKSYFLEPVNIGNPGSISSFGKVRIDMDVGQQPVPVNDLTKINDTILLKVGWQPKDEALVSNPELYLFLPGDLGVCQDTTLNSYGVGNGLFQFSGSVIQDIYDKKSRFKFPDFECYNNLDIKEFCSNETFCTFTRESVKYGLCSTYPDLSDEDYDEALALFNSYRSNLCSDTKNAICNNLLPITSEISVNELRADPMKALTSFTNKSEVASGRSLRVPGAEGVCDELVNEMNYSICKARFNPTTNEVLFCTLSLKGIDVSEVDMNTYLVRADAVYDFHDVTITNFNIDNCDAI
ncbi:MAG: hypothetical protein JW791_05045 [Nanoarchaeota archaeon]|nr:hypothetical protein [Nanoarchaeota archaeon]